MRTLLACSVLILPAGCAAARHDPSVLAVGARGPDIPPAVIRTGGEFDDFLSRVRTRPEAGPTGPDGLAGRLEAGRPDFDRQVLVVVRHDAGSGSAFGFSTSNHRGALVCDIRTRRVGTPRDHRPYWFAVVVDRPGPERVEVRVDGQPGEARTGP